MNSKSHKSKVLLVCISFFLRIVYAVGFSCVEPVTDGITLTYLEDHSQDISEYGKERLFGKDICLLQVNNLMFYSYKGAVGWAIGNGILGLCIDKWGFNAMYILTILTFITYVWSCILFNRYNITKVISIDCNETGDLLPPSKLNAKSLKIDNDNFTSSPLCYIIKLLCSTSVGVGFIIAFLVLSMGGSVVENLIFLFYEVMNANYTFCGFSCTVTVLFEFPFFYFAPYLLEKIGSVWLLQIGLLAFVVRVIGYTFVPKNMIGLLLVFESLHGISYSFYKTSGVDYIGKISPPGFEATGQGFLNAIR